MVRSVTSTWPLGIALACSALTACSHSDSSPSQDASPTPGVHVEIKRPIKLRKETRVPQNDPSFQRAEVTADGIVFFYRAKPTIALKVGHVVVGSGKAPYLRRIVKIVSRSHTRVEVETDAAQLTDAIADGAFRVWGTPRASDWVVGAEKGISGRKIFLDTTIKVLSLDDHHPFNCEVAGGGGFDLSPVLEPAIDEFSLEVDIEPTLVPLGAKLVAAKFLIDASLTAGVMAKISRALSAQCGVDLVKLIGHKLNIDLSVSFPIGPIPGELTIKIEPVLTLAAAAQAKVEVTFTPQFTVGAKAGVSYTAADGWSDTFEVRKKGSLAPVFPDVGGEVSVGGKVTAGLKLATLLYDTAGPTIAVTHFGEGKLTAKVPECTWDATLDLGTDVTLGAETTTVQRAHRQSAPPV